MTPKTHNPVRSAWGMLPDYDGQSQFYHCSNCGLPHRTGSGEPVLRGGHIEMEGFFDICIDCARQAGEAVGLIDPEVIEHLDESVRRLGKQLQELIDEVEAQSKLIDAYEALIDQRPAKQARLADPEE